MKIVFLFLVILCFAVEISAQIKNISPETLKRLEERSKLGSNDATYQLALVYYYGFGVSIDKRKAFSLFRAAAQDGNAIAATNLGIMYEHGIGTQASNREAFKWYQTAAASSDSVAAFRCGLMLYEGTAPDVPEEDFFPLARSYFEKAVSKRFLPAYTFLGLMYEYGVGGLQQDFPKAFELYSEGCDGMGGISPSLHDELHPASNLFDTVTEPDYSDIEDKSFDETHAASDAHRRVLEGTKGWIASSYGTRGDPDACYHLSMMECYGRGAVRSHASCVQRLVHNAMNKNHGPSAYLLGSVYTYGLYEVSVDYEKALFFLDKAAKSADERVNKDAKKAFEDLKLVVGRAIDTQEHMMKQWTIDTLLPPIMLQEDHAAFDEE